MKRRIALAFVLVVFAAMGLTAQARWELLGQRNVTDKVDHDTIVVTKAKGDFKAIMLDVRGRGVDFHRVLIHFANGADQVVELRATIPAGGQSRVIDIDGSDRFIRSIDFWYDSKSLGRRGRSTVRVLGRH